MRPDRRSRRGHGLHPLYSANLFNRPSFVAEYNCSSCFEYAILDEDSFVIRYVRFCDIESSANALFPKEFFPTLPLMDSDLSIVNGNNYCIYDI